MLLLYCSSLVGKPLANDAYCWEVVRLMTWTYRWYIYLSELPAVKCFKSHLVDSRLWKLKQSSSHINKHQPILCFTVVQNCISNTHLCMLCCRDFETLLHIVKATVGSGILNLPAAVMNAGVLVGNNYHLFFLEPEGWNNPLGLFIWGKHISVSVKTFRQVFKQFLALIANIMKKLQFVHVRGRFLV